MPILILFVWKFLMNVHTLRLSGCIFPLCCVLAVWLSHWQGMHRADVLTETENSSERTHAVEQYHWNSSQKHLWKLIRTWIFTFFIPYCLHVLCVPNEYDMLCCKLIIDCYYSPPIKTELKMFNLTIMSNTFSQVYRLYPINNYQSLKSSIVWQATT